MKIEPEPEEFTPKTLKLTFESQKELDIFGSLFNTTVICDNVPEIPSAEIRKGLKKLGAAVDDYPSVLTQKIREHRLIKDFQNY